MTTAAEGRSLIKCFEALGPGMEEESAVEGPLSRRFIETFRVQFRYDTLRGPSSQIAEVTNALVLSRMHRRHRLSLLHAAEYRPQQAVSRSAMSGSRSAITRLWEDWPRSR
jgi:hypothetical protein